MKKTWNALSQIGINKLKDTADSRYLILLNRIVVIVTINFLLLFPLTIYFNVPLFSELLVAGILLQAMVLLFNYCGWYNLARIYLLLLGMTFVSTVVLVSGKDSGSQITYILGGTLPLIIFRNARLAMIFLFINILLFAVISYWMEGHSAVLTNISPELKRISYYLNILCNMVLVFYMVLHFKKINAEHEGIILKNNEEIILKNKEITDSIRYARRIQQSLLPTEKYIDKTLTSLKN
jgi:hypothetical protein